MQPERISETRPKPVDANSRQDGEYSGTPDEPTAEARAVEELRELIHTGSNMVRDLLELLAVEGRLAGRSLALILCGGLVLALLVPAIWTLLNFAAGLWLTGQGVLSAPAALLIFAVLNVVFGFLLWLGIRRLSRNLAFPELLNAVSGMLPGRGNKETIQ